MYKIFAQILVLQCAKTFSHKFVRRRWFLPRLTYFSLWVGWGFKPKATVRVNHQKPKLPRKLQKTIGLGYYLPLDSINLKNTCLLCLYMKSNGPLQVDCECASCFTIFFFLRQFNLWRSVKTDKKLGQERRENTQKRPTVQTWTWHMVACSLTELNWLPSICFTINVTQCTTAPKDTLCISVRRQQLWQNGST